MLIGMALLLRATWLLLADFEIGVCTVLGEAAGCGAMACISMGGAEGVGVRSSLVRWQNFQKQMPMVKVLRSWQPER